MSQSIISIDAFVASELLLRNPFRYLAELIALERNVPPVPRMVYGNTEEPSALLLVEEYPHGVFTSLTEFDTDFVQACAEWMHRTFATLTVASTDSRVFSSPALSWYFTLGELHRSRSYVCTAPEDIPPITIRGGKLTEADSDAVEQYPRESAPQRPGLQQYFQWYVLEGRGEIYAVKHHADILAYVACSPELEPIWDVALIHVREDHRGRGLGMQVAALYAHEKLAQGFIPYYSSAANEASEQIATQAGFTCCREFYYAEASRKDLLQL